MQAFQLLLDGLQRLRQALDLAGHLLGRDRVMRHLERCVRDKLRPANGDAAGDTDTVQDEAHARRYGEGQRGKANTGKAVKFLPVW